MKNLWLVMVMLVAVPALAEEISVERGRELFESDRLGTNKKSCATCHPGGRRLEWAAASYDEGKLTGTVNRCIQQTLKGNPLDPESAEMKSLLLYIRTFGGATR